MIRRALFLTLVLAGCSRTPEPASPLCPRSDDHCLAEEAARYVGDQAYRRQVLLASLVSHDNSYAQERLENYALPAEGWDLRAEVDPPTEPVTMEDVLDGEAGRPLQFRGNATGVLDGQPGPAPDDLDGLRHLGQRAFREFPVQRSGEMEVASSSMARLASSGVVVAADGTLVGLRKVTTVAGYPAIAVTCALCHSSQAADGTLRDGIANRQVRYGDLRIALYDDLAATGTAPLSDEVRAMLSAWGPGRVDVTPDGMDNPLAIPDLIGIRDVPYLHRTATLRHSGATALATRLETLILTRSQSLDRPPLTVTFAMAVYLYSLLPPPVPPPTTEEERQGESLFSRRCAGCHVAERGYSGEPIPLEAIGTDARAGLSTERGTGSYRPASLVGAATAAPYLHDGSVASLEDLLDPARLEPGFSRGVHSPGPVPGHTYGLELSDGERAALIAYLETFSAGP